MNTLKVLQHNVRHWRTNKNSLINSYMEFNPHIILINSHGVKDNDTLKIPGYYIHKINSCNEINDGSAIAVKHNIQYKIDDDFDTDILAIEISTSLGKFKIATTYLPSRRAFLPFTDFHKLLSDNTPTFIVGDFNARHRCLGNSSNNTVGTSIHRLINQGHLHHLGPNFRTFPRHTSATTPDLVFSNKFNFYNTLIVPGNLSTSDHIPIQITISTEPIMIPCEERYNLNKAD